MSLVDDPVQLLREARPELDPRDPLATPRCAPPRPETGSNASRRHAPRLALVAAIACAAILSGVLAIDSTDRGTNGTIGISSAEARERAIDALQGVGELEDFQTTQAWSATETGGERRTSANEWTFARVNGDTSRSSWTVNEFAGIELRAGLEHRSVDGRVYQSRGHTRHIDTPWILDVRSGWAAPGSNSRPIDVSALFFKQPDFPAIVDQLEREGLIDARVERDGTTVVTLQREARELAPVTASIPMGDPVASFAAQFLWGRDAHPDTTVTVRITVGSDGNLRGVRASAVAPVVHADGQGGTDPIESEIVSEQRWKPRSKPVAAPDPSEVTVVGNVLEARRGEGGLAGPLGTLDQLTLDEMRELRRDVLKTPSAAYDGRARTSARPARSYPKLFARRRAEQIAFRKAVAALEPIDRSSFVDDPSCSPLWPNSQRAMDLAEARRDPDAAGWKCDLGSDIGDVVIMPEPRGITEWMPPSGGVVGWGAVGYQAR